MRFLIRVAISAAAIWLTTLVVDGIDVVGGDDTGSTVLVLLGVGLVFGLVNGVVKPVVKAVALPLYLLTLGLFTLVVNALMLMLTGWITERLDWGLRIEDFWSAVVAALLVSVLTFVLSLVVPGARKKDDD